MRRALILAGALAAASPQPAAGAPAVAERARLLMGTTCRIAVAHPASREAAAAADAALDGIARWESILSDYDPDSELSRLNASAFEAPFACSPDLFGFLEASVRLSEATRGAFDVTVGPLVDLYALRDGGRWPGDAEIESTLSRVGWRRLILDPAARTARFAARGMRLDPGAIGKGYALDAAARLLRERGVARALIDFGGQILEIDDGSPPAGETIEVASRGRRSPVRRAIRLENASASTSANDERGRFVDGRLLGHILDPRSGRPASGALSVTVVAPSATDADALSTALFVLGPEEGAPLASRLGAEALFTAGDPPAAPASHPSKGSSR